jgi:hypothetical protein
MKGLPMKRFLTSIILLLLHSPVSTAAVVINMLESGENVVATATGSIKTSGLTPSARGSTVVYEGSFRGNLGFAALDGNIFVGQGGGSVDEYVIETTLAFSTGGYWGSGRSPGEHVGIISRSDLGDSITVPKGYNSGGSISGTSTWFATTLAAMGAIPGTYEFTWGSGIHADSLTLNISSAPAPIYTVGGTISGLTGSVTLKNSGGDDLVRSADGSFTFANTLADGSDYVVTVFTQPTGQICSVSNGNGTISGADVSNVSVNCVTNSGALPISGRIGTLSFTSTDSGCAFSGDPQFLPESSATPAPQETVNTIDGVVQFTIDGCAPGATVHISMDYGADLPDGATYWKVADPLWYPIDGAIITGRVVQFSITDGGPNDHDGVDFPNGKIVDPSGAVFASGSATDIFTNGFEN